MNTFFTPDRLRSLFQNQFNLSEWLTYLQQFFQADELRVKPEPLDTTNEQGYYLGAINTPDHYHIGLFHYVITHGSVVNRRVGLRKLVEQFTHKRWGDFDAALVVFSSHDHWRLSLICDIDGEATSPKRFTYVFGSRDLLYRTPIERFSKLQKEGVTFAKMREAFSVEALSDEFFERYREQYADFVEYVTGKRYVKSGTKWVERVMGPANEELISAFKQDEKRVRDYIKKMMGRITFLHFLQRKGWMCGDLNYMQHLFERSPYQDNYLDAVLEPLFFGILNTRPEEREALFTAKGWNLNLLSEWKSIPYLNGGLFECEAEDLTTCRFPVEYFQRLFQFFSEYNFTIDENDPTDAEVGVDPEMLGKIFENLLEDNKDKGAFYTPKEIVRYMCRESLIAYLVTQSMERGNTNPREKVEASIRDLLNKPEEIVPRMNERQKREFGESLYRLKICDPAIGSGAFPMGLLNELVRLRSLIDAWAKDDNGKPMVGDYAALKSEIICNNIYGVDIERGAIDIARLRFWLSIVVDEVTPHTLPNLDYKFMQGNSLITTFNGEYINLDSKQEHANIVKMRNEKKHLYELKQQYYTATGERKHQLNVDIKDSILSLIALQLDFEYRQWFDHHNTMNYLPGMGIPQQLTFADIKQKLPAEKQRMCDIGSALRKQLHDESKPLAERAKIDIRFFDWRMMFTEVFEGQNPGFDIVIGNPPYVLIDKNIFKKEYHNDYHYQEGKIDLYRLFIEKGTYLLNQKGVMSYITPNTFLSIENCKLLRRYLLNNFMFLFIRYYDYDVFQSASVNNIVFALQKDTRSCTDIQNEYITDNGQITTSTLRINDIMSSKTYSININACDSSYDIKRKMETNSIPLGEITDMEMCLGAQPYHNSIHTEEEMKSKFLHSSYKVNEDYVLDNGGKNFGKYTLLSPSKKWIDYSAEFYTKPDERFFNFPRIVIREITGKTLVCHYLEDFHFFNKSVFIVRNKQNDIHKLKYIIGLLNSVAVGFYISAFGDKSKQKIFPRASVKMLRSIPIPYTSDKIEYTIILIVDRILAAKKENPQADTSALEAEIDQLVYQLYGLTDEEIEIIEKANE